MEEEFSIEVGDIIRDKKPPHTEYEILQKYQPNPGADWHYLLRRTDGKPMTDVMRPFHALAPSAVRVSCEQWAMKRVTSQESPDL